jgi:hypothetical protein
MMKSLLRMFSQQRLNSTFFNPEVSRYVDARCYKLKILFFPNSIIRELMRKLLDTASKQNRECRSKVPAKFKFY